MKKNNTDIKTDTTPQELKTDNPNPEIKETKTEESNVKIEPTNPEIKTDLNPQIQETKTEPQTQQETKESSEPKSEPPQFILDFTYNKNDINKNPTETKTTEKSGSPRKDNTYFDVVRNSNKD